MDTIPIIAFKEEAEPDPSDTPTGTCWDSRTEIPNWQKINIKEERYDIQDNSDTANSQVQPPVVPQITYACIVCGSMFPEVPQVLDHIMKLHRGGVLCLKCKCLMPSNIQLKEHEQNCHTERPFFLEYIKCGICCTLFQYNDCNALEVCNNCILQCKQDISLSPNIKNLQVNLNIHDRLDLKSNNDEFIDINTYIIKTENVDEPKISLDDTKCVSPCTVLMESQDITNNEIIPKLISVKRTKKNINSKLKVPLRKIAFAPEKNTTVELNLPRINKYCKNSQCSCALFAKEKLDMSSCQILCNIQNKLLKICKDELSRDVEYFIFCIVCKKDLLLNVYFASHTVQYHKSMCCICPMCGRNISSYSIPQFLKHFDDHLLDVTPKDCIICKASFLSDFNLHKHVMCYHSPHFAQDKPPEKMLSEIDVERLSFMKTLYSPQLVRETFSIHCNSCGEDFSSEDYFEEHLLECKIYNLYSCSFCFEHYLVERDTFIMQMWVHCQMKDCTSYYMCQICNLSFPTLENETMHKINKHGLKAVTSAQRLTLAMYNKLMDVRKLDIANQKNMLKLGTSCSKKDSKNQLQKFVQINKKVVNTEQNHLNNNVTITCLSGNSVQLLHTKRKTIMYCKPKKIGREELQVAVIPKQIKQQVNYILNKFIVIANRHFPNTGYFVFCVACKNDILFKDFITKHFIPCYEINGGKCSYCGKETEDERNNVLDHLLHVWNSHIAVAFNNKMHLCTICNILLPLAYNLTLHKAVKHSIKL